jgi:hypothetical protein
MASGTDEADASRTATIRTVHERSATIAAAVAPDNTAEMETRVESEQAHVETGQPHVESGAVVTTIERETTGGLQSTVDDYVVNLDVAEAVAGSAAQFGRKRRDARKTTNTEQTTTDQTTDTNGYGKTERQ